MLVTASPSQCNTVPHDNYSQLQLPKHGSEHCFSMLKYNLQHHGEKSWILMYHEVYTTFKCKTEANGDNYHILTYLQVISEETHKLFIEKNHKLRVAQSKRKRSIYTLSSSYFNDLKRLFLWVFSFTSHTSLWYLLTKYIYRWGLESDEQS